MADGFLFDVRCWNWAMKRASFAASCFAGAGADVIKVEPPGGAPTRENGPFYHDQPDPEPQPLFLALQCRQARRSRWNPRPPRAEILRKADRSDRRSGRQSPPGHAGQARP